MKRLLHRKGLLISVDRIIFRLLYTKVYLVWYTRFRTSSLHECPKVLTSFSFGHTDLSLTGLYSDPTLVQPVTQQYFKPKLKYPLL